MADRISFEKMEKIDFFGDFWSFFGLEVVNHFLESPVSGYLARAEYSWRLDWKI